MTDERVARLRELLTVVDAQPDDYNDNFENCDTCGVWWMDHRANCAHCVERQTVHDTCLTMLKEFSWRELADEVLRLRNPTSKDQQ